MRKRLLAFVLGCLWVVVGTSLAIGADLAWDYPADWAEIEGWTLYFSDGSNTFNKSFGKTDVTEDGTTVTYSDIENKLNLHFDVTYTMTLHAFNDMGESTGSNAVEYTRSGYDPPVDVLPEPVPSGSSAPSNIVVQ